MKTTKWIDVPGAELAVASETNPGAAGLPVVFLHANVADRRMWHGQWAAVAARHPAIAYDRRGFGESRTVVATPHSNVADLWAVLDALGHERAVLVGCSLGGRVALDAALARPDRVAGLFLVAPGVSGAPAATHDEATQALIDATSAATARGDIDAKNELQALLWLDGPLGGAGRVGGAARELFLAMNGIALRAADPGAAVAEPSAWDRLEQVQVPTLVLWGDLDLPRLQERSQTLARRMAGAQAVVLAGTAHLPGLEAPERFNAVLGGFLESRQLDPG